MKLFLYVIYTPVAGTVAELTATAKKETCLTVGDRVMALVGGGGYAGILCVKGSQVLCVDLYIVIYIYVCIVGYFLTC